MIGYALAFGCYVLCIHRSKFLDFGWFELLGIGIVVRLFLMQTFPNFSDDIYRFHWDGKMIWHGLNPYSYLPIEVLEKYPEAFTQEHYDQLNSPDYYTIYPPIGQCLFALAGFCKTTAMFSIALKGIFILFELLSMYFLVKILHLLDLPKLNAFMYFLNPLVIIEGVGNLHMEVVMCSFLFGALYMLLKGKEVSAIIYYVLAIGTKLIPLILGPLILFKLIKKERKLSSLGIGLLACTLVFAPVFLGLNFKNLGTSLDLYFRSFEFNASIYYVLREIGFLFSGYNIIQSLGPSLALTTLTVILYQVWKTKEANVPNVLEKSILILSVFYFLSTTVHPWYLITLVAITALLKRPKVYVIAWSFLATLSYSRYMTPDLDEHLGIIAIEYIIVFTILVFETFKFEKVIDQIPTFNKQ